MKVPCEFTVARDINGRKVGYHVTIYYVVYSCAERPVPFEIHTFTSQTDAFDNALLAREVGVFAEVKHCRLLASNIFYPDIYKLIEEYVSSTNYD